MSIDHCTVRCTCTPSRGYNCRKCWGPPLIDPQKVAAQLTAMLEKQLPAIVGDDHAKR